MDFNYWLFAFVVDILFNLPWYITNNKFDGPAKASAAQDIYK